VLGGDSAVLNADLSGRGGLQGRWRCEDVDIGNLLRRVTTGGSQIDEFLGRDGSCAFCGKREVISTRMRRNSERMRRQMGIVVLITRTPVAVADLAPALFEACCCPDAPVHGMAHLMGGWHLPARLAARSRRLCSTSCSNLRYRSASSRSLRSESSRTERRKAAGSTSSSDISANVRHCRPMGFLVHTITPKTMTPLRKDTEQCDESHEVMAEREQAVVLRPGPVSWEHQGVEIVASIYAPRGFCIEHCQIPELSLQRHPNVSQLLRPIRPHHR
jgi:hypothetical protein